MLDGYYKAYETDYGVSREQWRQMKFKDRLSLAQKVDADEAKYAGDARQLYQTNAALNWARLIGKSIGDAYSQKRPVPHGYDFNRPASMTTTAAGRLASETLLPHAAKYIPGGQKRQLYRAASKTPIQPSAMAIPAAAFVAGDVAIEPMINDRSMQASKEYYGRMGLKGAVAQAFPAYANLIGKAIPKIAQWTGAVTPEEAQSLANKRYGDKTFGPLPWQK